MSYRQLTTTAGSGRKKLTRNYHPEKEILTGTLSLVLAAGMLPTSLAPCLAADQVKPADVQLDQQKDQKVQTGQNPQPIQNIQNAATSTAPDTTAAPRQRIILKKGMEVEVSTKAEDLVPTDDAELAKKQVDAYPDNAEASFIYAVALTRTSRVEEALKEIRRARRLAEKDGGPAYFDKMIASYEEMLKNYPDDNRIRYGLAWAYYMKAYLIARQSKQQQEYLEKLKLIAAAKEAKAQPAKPAQVQGAQAPAAWLNAWASPYLPKDKDGNPIKLPELKTGADAPHIKGALEQAAPSVVPQIRTYYQSALGNLDELIRRKPDDVWAIAYRAHLSLEFSGDLESSMSVWRDCAQRFPNNPAAFFFLGEGYLKQGNLKESLSNISRAIALRGVTK